MVGRACTCFFLASALNLHDVRGLGVLDAGVEIVGDIAKGRGGDEVGGGDRDGGEFLREEASEDGRTDGGEAALLERHVGVVDLDTRERGDDVQDGLERVDVVVRLESPEAREEIVPECDEAPIDLRKKSRSADTHRRSLDDDTRQRQRERESVLVCWRKRARAHTSERRRHVLKNVTRGAKLSNERETERERFKRRLIKG